MHVKMTRKERREIRRLAVAYQEEKTKHRGEINISRLMMDGIAMIFIASGYKLFGKLKPELPEIWIGSPSNKTIKQLPVYQAMRIVRKQHWHYLKMTPELTRWEHLKIALLGGQRYEILH